MSKTVWKLFLGAEDEQSFTVPAGAEALSVQIQHDRPCLWILCNPANEEATMTVWTVGTGHDYEGDGEFVGTFQLHDGLLVFHVFAKETS